MHFQPERLETLGGLLHKDKRKKALIWEGNPNLYRLVLLPGSTEEGSSGASPHSSAAQLSLHIPRHRAGD